MNFCDPHGAVLDCYALQGQANQCGISVRSGCFCNPGVREVALGFVREDLANCFRKKERMTYEQFLHVIDDQKQGALRVSVGLATNFADVYQFLQFASSFVDRWAPPSAEEETSLAPLAERSFTRVCACGYGDSRFEKRFCPSCGRPMPAVVHPSTKESLNVQVLTERSSRSVRGLV